MRKCLTKKIRKIRIENKLTIQKLAEQLDIAASTLGMYERGMRNPDLELVIKIANMFNVDIRYFYEEDFEIDNLLDNIKDLDYDFEVLNAKQRAKGFCELCEVRAPFLLEDGEPYLEKFKITIENSNRSAIVMLCPNCLKKVSILNYSGDINYLRKKIEREFENDIK